MMRIEKERKRKWGTKSLSFLSFIIFQFCATYHSKLPLPSKKSLGKNFYSKWGQFSSWSNEAHLAFFTIDWRFLRTPSFTRETSGKQSTLCCSGSGPETAQHIITIYSCKKKAFGTHLRKLAKQIWIFFYSALLHIMRHDEQYKQLFNSLVPI